MSVGKDIRANMEDALEEAVRNWMDTKVANGPTDSETKTKRGIVRGLAIAISIQRDPEDYDNEGAHKMVEKEFLSRVKD
ncbi:MAG: hypothetical protein ACREOZ_02110 [Gloeomargaritales cyanobacterium]